MQNLTQRQSGAVTAFLGFLHTVLSKLCTAASAKGANSKVCVVTAALVYTAAASWIDFITPTGMHFEFFFVAGCAFVGWVAGTRAALPVAFASSLALFYDDWRSHLVLPPMVVGWNSLVRLAGFTATGWIAAEAGQLTRNLEWVVQRRTAILQTEVEEHKATATRLRETLQLLRQVTENITEVFWVTDPAKSRMSYVSPGFERIWGQPCKNVYAAPETWLEAVHPDDRERVTRATYAKQVTGEYDENYRVVRPDGSVCWVQDRAFPVRNERGEVYRIVGITEDITGRLRLEQQILEISDREQARIGQDIHDGLSQLIVGAALHANALNQAPDLHFKHASVQKVCSLLNDALTESRRVTRGLYPVRLETEGLAPALDELARTTSERYNLECCFISNTKDTDCDKTTATHLYRIAQEAVNNAVKHSGSPKIIVRLDYSAGAIELQVQDHGQGIRPSSEPRSGMGLHIMDYRAHSIGTSLHVDTNRQGTIISCRVPYQITTS